MKAIIEGLLFVTGDEGISIKELASVLEQDENAIIEIIQALKEDYKGQSRGIQLVDLAGSYQLTTKPEHAVYFKKLVHTPGHTGLSQAALETLAITAYRQPITRSEIEEIRGVKTDKALQTLVSKLLVKDIGLIEGSGRAILYGTTKEFLDYFALSSIEDLPPLPEQVDDTGEEDADLFYKKFEESMEELFTNDNNKK
jgi:segregation and condensation protein B